jgi:hypothetical protein
MAVLRYPYEALTNSTDYLQIDISTYTKIGPKLVNSPANNRVNVVNNLVENTKSQNLSTTSFKSNTGTILLPMPSNIQDGNSVSYADDSLNGLVAGAVSKVTGVLNVDITSEGAGKQLTGGAAGLVGMLANPDVKTAYMRSLAAQAVSVFGGNVTVDQLLARETGEIFNPNMELLFNGVTLRAFKFSFKMTPRNVKESQQIRLIIRSLKQNMAPKSGTNDNFLSTPNIFELRYKQGNRNHDFLHKFKQCFLTDIAINYTGENVYATYADGSPISYLMDLSFKEIAPIYAGDYDSDDGLQGVGY